MSSASLLRSFRVLHLYIGIFISPALLFFAFTGALQTFSLHETTKGRSYEPPRWAVVLGQIHKKQTSIVPVRRPSPPEKTPEPAPGPARAADAGGTASAAARRPPAERGAAAETSAPAPTRHPLPLKIFFLLVAIGLFTSTLTGIYMSYKYNRNARVVTALLVLGAVIPIILVFV